MFKKVGWVAVRLLLIPGIVEALVAGGVAVAVFKMPVLLALALGFILKPVDPAIVLNIMCAYQARGAGVATGIPRHEGWGVGAGGGAGARTPTRAPTVGPAHAAPTTHAALHHPRPSCQPNSSSSV